MALYPRIRHFAFFGLVLIPLQSIAQADIPTWVRNHFGPLPIESKRPTIAVPGEITAEDVLRQQSYKEAQRLQEAEDAGKIRKFDSAKNALFSAWTEWGKANRGRIENEIALAERNLAQPQNLYPNLSHIFDEKYSYSQFSYNELDNHVGVKKAIQESHWFETHLNPDFFLKSAYSETPLADSTQSVNDLTQNAERSPYYAEQFERKRLLVLKALLSGNSDGINSSLAETLPYGGPNPND